MYSNEDVVRVQGISKRFEVFATPRDQLKQFVLPRLERALGRRPSSYFKEFWALQDVSFQVKKGESYAIVGLNGSGKSTLLQIICGTLSPTTGSVSVGGRVAALLELGAGFSPDFSGLENVYMNGALLGYSKEEISSKLEEIRAFADIGDHFERRVVTYSSGMQVRLAFAVATAFDPEILVVDEALAVGDAFFQQKCFHRIEQIKSQGGTLLFVSHDANTVKHLCDKAILLSKGRVIIDDVPKKVIDLYEGLIAQMTDFGDSPVSVSQMSSELNQSANVPNDTSATWSKATTITTNRDADLLEFRVLSDSGAEISNVSSESNIVVNYVVRLNKEFDRPAFGIIIRDKFGRSLFETRVESVYFFSSQL
jgi:ABC-type polysaccharide/polyol phosphate transport system ATPase subunit